MLQRCYDAIREAGFAASTYAPEWGGGGFSRLGDTAIPKEQFGQLTNGLRWLMLPPANALRGAPISNGRNTCS